MNQGSKVPGKASRPEDLTGRDRLVWNTVVSWFSQIIVILAGFALPRLMHDTLGVTMLGIWDFAWTFVNYFNLMSLGIGSSVNRFVAKLRAEGKSARLNELISTVVIIQVGISLVVMLTTLLVAISIDLIYAEKLGENLRTAELIVLFLGASLAIEMLVNSARGVITGYHRWDIHNAIYAGSSLLTLVLMAGVLLYGGDIVDVSIAYLASTVVTELVRIAIAWRIAPDLKLKINHFSRKQALEVTRFGVKTLFLAFPQVVLVQGVNLVTVSFLGPAALAIFARPFALIRHLYTIVFKFTMILTPTAGSLQSVTDQGEIHKFTKSTLRFNFAIALPAIAFFTTLGDLVVTLWMGEEYRNWPLIAVLAVGHLLSIGQDGLIRIMQGLDQHGVLSVYLFVSVAISATCTFLVLNTSVWTLTSSAFLLVVPMTFAFGIVLPVFSCYKLEMRLIDYLYHSLLVPMLWNLPFISGLVLARFLFEEGEYWLALICFALASILEAALYYKLLLPATMQSKVTSKLRGFLPGNA